MKRFTGVVMPAHSPFDKIVALCLYCRFTGQKLEELDLILAREYQPEQSQIDAWKRAGYFLIDIGEYKYQRMNKGSATEIVAEALQVRSHRLLPFVELCNKNNQTGDLKKLSNSLVWILREMYKQGYKPLTVISRIFKVIDAHIRAVGKEMKIPLNRRHPDVQELVQKLGGHKSSWCMSGYIRNLMILGTSDQEILREARWWREVFRKCRLANEQVKVKALALLERSEKFTFQSNGKRQRGVLIRTDDTRVPRALLNKGAVDLIIVTRRTRLVTILTSNRVNPKINLDQLFGVIIGTEATHREDDRNPKDIWFYDKRINAILNGSGGARDTTPTVIAASAFVNLVKDAIS
ncbi:hypothetical protein KJ733_01875 [Patescibacteria group bacterium]|nr:hypothetical protein [Patescibacteria group bacterium]MBU1951641.1 hypothetical protein [Patescibacteria group bacterium]